MAVKLNLAKPPRFNQVIYNYIKSAKHRIEVIKQHNKMQLLHQQQQHQLYLQQQLQHKDIQIKQKHSQNQTNRNSQQQQQPQNQYHPQLPQQQQIQHHPQTHQPQILKTREVFEEQQRLTPRYININSGNTRKMYNSETNSNSHQKQQEHHSSNVNITGLKNLQEQQRKNRQPGSLYDEREELEIIQHL